MNRFKLTLFAVLLLVTAAALPARLPAVAQGDNACPALVEGALALADESCAGLGRNTVCYGHMLVEAIDWQDDPLADFDAPGAVTDVVALASLTTAPLVVEDDQWGVAVMALQADLPDSLPGQGLLPGQVVTFVVFGDVSLRSEVAPGEADVPAEPACLARASAGVNLRAGPSTADAVVGGMAAGDALPVLGRNETGDWLQVEIDGETAWVSAGVVTEDCGDASSDIAYTAPMQAFFLETGFGEPACTEAPRDGLLVQAPQNTTVHFRVNGVEVAVGSTAFLAVAPDDRLSVATFDGTVTVTSGGQSVEVEPGFQVLAAADAPPGDPRPYVVAQVEAVPVHLLPDPVTVPNPPAATPAPAQPTATPTEEPTVTPTATETVEVDTAGSGDGATVTVDGNSSGGAWTDSGLALGAGQRFSVAASGTVNLWASCAEEIDTMGAVEFTCADLLVGPEGNPMLFARNPAPMPLASGYPMVEGSANGALLGRVGGGAMFHIGSGGTFTADSSGSLLLMINDIDHNNGGAFTVTITVD